MISSIRLVLLAAALLLGYVRGSEDECLKSDYVKVFGAGKATYKNSIAMV